MGIRWQPLTPLAAVLGGVLAGAVGTVCLDAVQYVRYRRDGGTKTPLEWEFAAIDSWADAPAPGQVGKRVIEGFTQRELPDRWAWLISTRHALGLRVTRPARRTACWPGRCAGRHPWYGVPFGALVCASDYVILPEGGLYKPIWEYDAKTLGDDLSAHLAYGAGTGVTFWLFTRLR